MVIDDLVPEALGANHYVLRLALCLRLPADRRSR
jgi:hypothetical protein